MRLRSSPSRLGRRLPRSFARRQSSDNVPLTRDSLEAAIPASAASRAIPPIGSADPRPIQPDERQSADTYRAQSIDTSSDVDRRLMVAWRALPPWRKAELVCELGETAERFTLAGIRRRHPNASPRELALRLAVRRLGPDLVHRAFGWTPDG